MSVRPGIEAAARVLCAKDYERVPEPARSRYVDAQWRTYINRAEAAVDAFYNHYHSV